MRGKMAANLWCSRRIKHASAPVAAIPVQRQFVRSAPLRRRVGKGVIAERQITHNS